MWTTPVNVMICCQSEGDNLWIKMDVGILQHLLEKCVGCNISQRSMSCHMGCGHCIGTHSFLDINKDISDFNNGRCE